MTDERTEQHRDRAATIDDVALLAGVHRSTVSRALHRPDQVSPGTRQKVQQAAEVLEYRPNAAARSLSTGRAGVLALLVPDCANPFFSALLHGAQQRAGDVSSWVIVAETDRRADVELRLVRTLAAHVDGIIAASPASSAHELRRAGAGRPLATVGYTGVPGVDVVLAASAVAACALDHLHSLGHRSIAVVEGPPSSPSSVPHRLACQAWSDRQDHPAVHFLAHRGERVADGAAVADQLVALRATAGVTALLAFSDAVAVGVLGRLGNLGVRVPQDVSVVGLDDIDLAAAVPGGLTTVALGIHQLGAHAVDLVLGRAGAEGAAAVPEPQLIVRGSSGPPPVR